MILREPIPASLLTVGIILSFGYASGLIYSIGDSRQLPHIFLGLVAGTLVFSVVGFIIGKSTKNLVITTIISSALLGVAYAVIAVDTLVVDDFSLFIISILISSPSMPVSQLLAHPRQRITTWKNLMSGIVQAVLVIFLIFIYAYEYELKGQVDLFIGPLLFLVISVIYTLILKLI